MSDELGMDRATRHLQELNNKIDEIMVAADVVKKKTEAALVKLNDIRTLAVNWESRAEINGFSVVAARGEPGPLVKELKADNDRLREERDRLRQSNRELKANLDACLSRERQRK
jgi:hypothetical protein